MQQGRAQRADYEYKHNGTASLFMIFAPLEGTSKAAVSERHTATGDAQVLTHAAGTMFPGAGKILLVQDNLCTRNPAAPYQAFPPQKVRRLVERLE
ncbi:MAG: hypothetical protein L0Y57_14740 [Beijerinckiaceae bacterium]|nr:hypothetical protein [Beijerinckiaceae bacterium]